jgi:hypothetical protein
VEVSAHPWAIRRRRRRLRRCADGPNVAMCLHVLPAQLTGTLSLMMHSMDTLLPVLHVHHDFRA